MGSEGWGSEGLGTAAWGLEGWGPEGSGTAAWGLEGWGPEGGGPKILRFFFFPSPDPIFALFLSLSGGLLVEFWWCLKHRGTQMCMFGVLGLSCASPGGPEGRRGFTRHTESPNVLISGPRCFKHHQNSTRRPPEREKERKWGREGKKARNFGRSGGGGSAQGVSGGGHEKKKSKNLSI